MLGERLRTYQHRGWIGLVACVLVGCGGGGPNLQPLSGKVTLAGKPVVYGTIDFVPDSAKGNSGPATSAEIHNGDYDTRDGGRGVLGGAYQVRITAYEQEPSGANEDETKPSGSAPPLFVGYSIEVADLKGTKDFDVPESAKGFGLGGAKPSGPKPGDP